MKIFFAILVTAIIAASATYFAVRKSEISTASTPGNAKAERRILYYQSAMHPWIKSDKPGRCTICGMELTPVYEGDAGFDATGGGDVVPLTQSMIQVLNVETATAEIRRLEKSLSVAGIIGDDITKHRVLSAYIPGRIEKLYVNFLGAEVKEGQPLAEFYSPALLQSEREYRTLTGELRQATALRLRQMGLTAAQIESLPEKKGDKLSSEILAPMTGTVVVQNVYEGQYVQEGEKLFELADFSTMWFQFRAYEQDLPWLKRGLKVDITTPAHPGFTYQGEITFIDPTLDVATRSAEVRVELANPSQESGHRMMHKLYADGLVHLEAPEVLTAPRTAVIETGPEAVVYVDQGGGAFSRRVVILGRRGKSLVEITKGLSSGEKVVINGNLLIDGQAEMNRAFAGAPHAPSETMVTNTVPLTEGQKNAIETLIQASDSISEALSKDNLTNFNAAGASAMTATDAVSKAFNGRTDLEDIIKHLSDAQHLHGASDLAAARKMFHPFSNAASRLIELLRSSPGVPPFELFECPMVDRAIPGVPKKGRWIQAAGREIGNPYFGTEMLDCGQKVTQ